MRYASPWDRTLRISTAAVVGVFAVIAAAAIVAGLAAGVAELAAIGVLLAALFAAIVLLTRALAPTGFAIHGGAVRIERRLRPLAVPLSQLRAAGPLPDGAASRALRLAGSGGLFGWYGRHWSRSLGEFRMYATRTRGLVQLDTPGARWVLSPEHPDRFLEELLAAAPRAIRVPAEGPHARHPVPRRTWLTLGAVLALIPAIPAGIVLATLAWAPTGVRVDREAVWIDRRWAAPLQVPLASVHRAEVLARDRVGRVWKVSGAQGLGAVAFGRFRSSTLGDFRLYAWRRGPWVLLETNDGRVVLTPEQPEGFVAEVRARLPP